MTYEDDVTLTAVAQELYETAASKGFHDIDNSRSLVDNMAVWVANLHGEVSEIWECVRRDKANNKCDKDCDLTNMEEEFADIVIRAFDSATAAGINIGKAVRLKAAYNATRPHMHGGKLR